MAQSVRQMTVTVVAIVGCVGSLASSLKNARHVSIETALQIEKDVRRSARDFHILQCVRAGWGLFRKRKWMKVSCFPLDGASEAKF